MQNLGCVQLHLPADAFENCGKLKPPLNTLFSVDSVGSITFQDMQRYLNLIVALFELCPKGTSELDLSTIVLNGNMSYLLFIRGAGEFSIVHMGEWFARLDSLNDGHLSQCSAVREAKRWCNDEL